MKAKVNPFYRSVVLSVDQSEVAELFFEDTNEWQSLSINGKMYDVHLSYEPVESFKNRHAWLNSLVSVYLVGDYTDDEYYSRNLITEITLDL
jgi:hypothetical protein